MLFIRITQTKINLYKFIILKYFCSATIDVPGIGEIQVYVIHLSYERIVQCRQVTELLAYIERGLFFIYFIFYIFYILYFIFYILYFIFYILYFIFYIFIFYIFIFLKGMKCKMNEN